MGKQGAEARENPGALIRRYLKPLHGRLVGLADRLAVLPPARKVLGPRTVPPILRAMRAVALYGTGTGLAPRGSAGYDPAALFNYLALLGWSPGDDRELFATREELLEAFDLSGLTRRNSVFNYRKGDPKFITDPKAVHINAQHLRSLDVGALAPLVKPQLEAAGIELPREELWERWIRADAVRDFERGRCTVDEFADALIGELGVEREPAELIDHDVDPYERNNLVDDPRRAEVRQRLQRILHADRK